MGFFGKIRETFRNHARDNICAGLQTLGIDAQMAERDRAEEKIGGKGSLGIIHIPEGTIRWINVRTETHSTGQYGGGGFDYYTEYGVPDPKLGFDSPWLRIKSTRVKKPPILGEVVDLRWWGEDFGFGIVSRLNSDVQLKQPLMESRDVTIEAHGEHRCWIISTKTRDVPSEELWNCYQKIARHLLADWSTE